MEKSGMSKIDIHADDYGISANTSKNIMDAILAGKLNSVSIMPNMSYFEEAKAYWFSRINKSAVDVSVHLNFMEGRCVANKEELSMLVNADGLFFISWGTLVKYCFHPVLYKKAKEQLKIEIKAQIEKVVYAYDLDVSAGFRIDSHQHTHMIPLVMKALVEVIKEEHWSVAYIRDAKEVLLPYFRSIEFWDKSQGINFIKVAVLNTFSWMDQKYFKELHLPKMILSGVFFSGKMNYERVDRILPELVKVAEKRDSVLEVLFHPGYAEQDELDENFNHPDANRFYVSDNRKLEYNTVMNLDISKYTD